MSALAMSSFDPLRDKTYQSTRLGRDVADFLAWMELGTQDEYIHLERSDVLADLAVIEGRA